MTNRKALMSPDVYRGKYDKDIIGKLEEYVTQQLKENTFDLEANLALLKLYQLFPRTSNEECIQRVLLKSLMNIKDNTFALAMYMIPERYHTCGDIATICKLAGLFETAEYPQFWALAKEKSDVVTVATGFNSAAREGILEVLSQTFKCTDLKFLSEALCLPDADLRTFLQTKGLKPDGGYVTFLHADLTQQWHQALPQTVQFDHLVEVFGHR